MNTSQFSERPIADRRCWIRSVRKNGQIVEHWEGNQDVPEKATNANGMF